MSYVKAAIIKGGVLDVFEVHGAELIMSTRVLLISGKNLLISRF